MKMLIEKSIILRQIKSLEDQISDYRNEIRQLENRLQATQTLLASYEDSSEIDQDPNTYREMSRDAGATSVEALKHILRSGPLELSMITERLYELGHFKGNANPRSSVHISLTRKPELFEKIKDGRTTKWRLRRV